MSTENVTLARRILAALGRRDLNTLLALSHPDVRWRSFFAALLEGGEYHGHEDLRHYLGDLHEAFEYLRPEIADLLDAGDIVVGVGKINYRGRGSGVETETPAGWVFKFKDVKLIEFRAFRDPEQALERVGLMPSSGEIR